jgi:beta-glucosidase
MPLPPGEVKEFVFEINPEIDLSYPDETGNTLLEQGYFTLAAGGLKKRFKYVE